MRKQMCLNTKACIYVSVNNYMTIVYLPDLDKTYLFLTVSLNSAELSTFMGMYVAVSVLHVCLWELRKSLTKVCEASEIKSS